MTDSTDLSLDEIPQEIDFSNKRGKFYSAGAHLDLPIYLDADVQTYLAERARSRGIADWHYLARIGLSTYDQRCFAFEVWSRPVSAGEWRRMETEE
jgi:hypothetical protein